MNNKRLPDKRFIKSGSKTDKFLERHLGSRLFTYGSIFKMLLPLILDQLFVCLIGLLTTAMISSSSQESVSAVSLVGPLYQMIYAVFSAISVGGTVIVAQYKGRGDTDNIRLASGQIILATVSVAVLSCLILIPCAGMLVEKMFGAADPAVIAKAGDYLIGVAISMIFLSLYMAAFGVFRGLGEAKTCLRLTVIINVIHLAASIVFLNIMKLDIIGTTLSLNLARAIGGFIALWLLIRPKSMVRVRMTHIFTLNRNMLKSVFRLGIPYAMEQIFFNGGGLIVQTFIMYLGTTSVAANAITNSAVSILFAAGTAAGTLATTVVGQCAGTGDKELARRYASRMVWLGTVMVLLSIIVFLPLMPVILKLYQAPADTLSLIYVLIFTVLVPMPFFWSASNVLPNILRSTGDSAFTSTVSLITMWTIRVGLGYVLTVRLGLGVQGLWLCMGLEWAVRTGIFYLRYRSGVWLLKKAID